MIIPHELQNEKLGGKSFHRSKFQEFRLRNKLSVKVPAHPRINRENVQLVEIAQRWPKEKKSNFSVGTASRYGENCFSQAQPLSNHSANNEKKEKETLSKISKETSLPRVTTQSTSDKKSRNESSASHDRTDNSNFSFYRAESSDRRNSIKKSGDFEKLKSKIAKFTMNNLRDSVLTQSEVKSKSLDNGKKTMSSWRKALDSGKPEDAFVTVSESVKKNSEFLKNVAKGEMNRPKLNYTGIFTTPKGEDAKKNINFGKVEAGKTKTEAFRTTNMTKGRQGAKNEGLENKKCLLNEGFIEFNKSQEEKETMSRKSNGNINRQFARKAMNDIRDAAWSKKSLKENEGGPRKTNREKPKELKVPIGISGIDPRIPQSKSPKNAGNPLVFQLVSFEPIGLKSNGGGSGPHKMLNEFKFGQMKLGIRKA